MGNFVLSSFSDFEDHLRGFLDAEFKQQFSKVLHEADSCDSEKKVDKQDGDIRFGKSELIPLPRSCDNGYRFGKYQIIQLRSDALFHANEGVFRGIVFLTFAENNSNGRLDANSPSFLQFNSGVRVPLWDHRQKSTFVDLINRFSGNDVAEQYKMFDILMRPHQFMRDTRLNLLGEANYSPTEGSKERLVSRLHLMVLLSASSVFDDSMHRLLGDDSWQGSVDRQNSFNHSGSFLAKWLGKPAQIPSEERSRRYYHCKKKHHIDWSDGCIAVSPVQKPARMKEASNATPNIDITLEKRKARLRSLGALSPEAALQAIGEKRAAKRFKQFL